MSFRIFCTFCLTVTLQVILGGLIEPVSNIQLNGRPILVPEVQNIQILSGRYPLPNAFTLSIPPEEPIIQRQLEKALTRFPAIKVKAVPQPQAICRFILQQEAPENPQGYRLIINQEGIQVFSRTATGLFYGAQTLQNLLSNAPTSELAYMDMTDWPDFQRRGYLMSIRTMKPEMMPVFKQTLVAMASFKMNWILLEIAEAFPYSGNPLSRSKNQFTLEQMKELADFCKELHIEVTPSLQVWSHARWMTFHPDWEQMSEGKTASEWDRQCCPLNQKAWDLTEQAIREQIAVFKPQIFFPMLDEISHGPWGSCPKCKAEKDLGHVYVNYIERIGKLIRDNGAAPMICQDSLVDGKWEHARRIRESLAPDWKILWWGYSDCLFTGTMKQFPGRELIGHSLTGKPNNTQNMLRAIRANGGNASTMVYWHYSGTGGMLGDLKRQTPEALGGFVNGLDYMWKYRETPYYELPYDATYEMMRRFQPENHWNDATPAPGTPLPIAFSVNTELSQDGRFPVLDDKTLNSFKKLAAEMPEKFQVVTAPQGRYYALCLSGHTDIPGGRSVIQIGASGRKASALSLLLTSSMPTHTNDYLCLKGGSKITHYGEALIIELTYTDNTRAFLPLHYRKDFTDWNRPFGGFNTHFVLRGLGQNNEHFRFCQVTLQNPHPEKGIRHISFVTKRLDGIAPAILAVSLLHCDRTFEAKYFHLDPAAVSTRAPSEGKKYQRKQPEVNWLQDFNNGMGQAKVIAGRIFKGESQNGTFTQGVVSEIIDDPDSPNGGKVLKIVIPPVKATKGGFSRVDVDFPCTIPPGHEFIVMEGALKRVQGFSHLNVYLVAPDNHHHVRTNLSVNSDWQTLVQRVRLNKNQDAPLNSLTETALCRITVFVTQTNEPIEFRLGRVGTASKAFSIPTVWKQGKEYEPN